MADLFISYSSVDLTAAQRLKRDLELHQHSVWLDVDRIDIGDSIVQKIDAGLASAQFVLYCFSERVSPWVDAEWMSTLARQLSGGHIKLLPVRLTGGRPPTILWHVRYADLVRNWMTGCVNFTGQ